METSGRGATSHGDSPPVSAADRRRVIHDATLLILLPAALAVVLGLTLAPGPGIALALIPAALLAPVLAAVSVLRRRPQVVSPADRVTLLRVGLIGVLTAAGVLILVEAIPARSWTLAALAGVALLLDAVDGWVARHTKSSSASGARLDMESDAAALLVVSCIAAVTVGWWVVAIGATRYLFVAAARFRPALRGDLAYSLFRRTVAAIQASVLWVALLPFTPVLFATAVTAIALALLVISFTRDAIRLERQGTEEPVR